MRITGGKARGQVLHGKVADGVRPTSDRAREALFSIVGQDLDGTTFLDAFGGTGLVGLDAWSRGARVTIVEQDRKVSHAIQARADELRANVDVKCGDVFSLGKRIGIFDAIFADPPWEQDAAAVVRNLGPLAKEVLVVEHDGRAELPEKAGELPFDRLRSYGRTVFSIYRVTRADGDPSP